MVSHMVPMACGATPASFAPITTPPINLCGLIKRVIHWRQRAIVDAQCRGINGTPPMGGLGVLSANTFNSFFF